MEYISYNTGTRALPDIYALALGRCAPSGIMHIYQAKHSCLCYNLYISHKFKKHLKTCHPEQYKCFETAEVKRKEKDREKHTSKESKPRQLSLPEKYFPSKQYGCHTKKYQAITLRLATFIGATNVPLNLVYNDQFRELIEELYPCYKLPHNKKFGIEIENLYSNVKSKISSSLQNARFISICTYIWSKPGLTASFLGITACSLLFSPRQPASQCYFSC